jgi:hypothetical protein
MREKAGLFIFGSICRVRKPPGYGKAAESCLGLGLCSDIAGQGKGARNCRQRFENIVHLPLNHRRNSDIAPP